MKKNRCCSDSSGFFFAMYRKFPANSNRFGSSLLTVQAAGSMAAAPKNEFMASLMTARS